MDIRLLVDILLGGGLATTLLILLTLKSKIRHEKASADLTEVKVDKAEIENEGLMIKNGANIDERYQALIKQMNDFQKSKDSAYERTTDEFRKDISSLKREIQTLKDNDTKQTDEIATLRKKLQFKNYALSQAHYCPAPKELENFVCPIAELIRQRDASRMEKMEKNGELENIN